jgi:2-C-methyl-D-erythritol 2,4-cyclodiphosphate synthase
MRIGQSTDIHRLVKDRPLILGGIHIPYEMGCLGHSDADALTHAIAEAILGALALGDLGKHFPDTDPKYKDISSLLILKEVILKMQSKHYHIGNIDALVLIEKPKLAPYIEQMKTSLCRVLEIESNQLNLKATRGEGLGFIGKGEGVVAQAVVILEETC